jgi:hypothetical protein
VAFLKKKISHYVLQWASETFIRCSVGGLFLQQLVLSHDSDFKKDTRQLPYESGESSGASLKSADGYGI